MLMDQQSAVTVIEGARRCPECAYVLEPFDTHCPRCALQRAQVAQAAQPVAAASVAAAPAAAPWDNTSGSPGAAAPPEILGWNWGAFLLTPFWAIAHSVWIGLLCFVPYVGWVMSIVLGLKGSEWAWQNRRFSSVEEFRNVQRTWMVWGIGLNVGVMALALIGIVAAVTLGAAGHAVAPSQ
jgi:hypothetical protein